MMTTLKSLPSEMIDAVFCYNDISFEDIINLRRVCRHFRWAAKAKKQCFLKKKFFQRWPTAKKYFEEQFNNNKQKKLSKNHQKNKKLSFIETGIRYARQLRHYNYAFQKLFKDCLMLKRDFKHMLYKQHFKEHLFQITHKTEKCVKLLIFMDEMKHFLTQPPRADDDLTERYCYIKLFDYLKMQQNKNHFKIFQVESHASFLEASATMLAQQLQFEKDVFYYNVKASLDTMALEVLDILRKKHPDHLIFSIPAERFSEWKENNIYENYWSGRQAVKIICALKEYMFDILHFKVFYSKVNKLDYICIDYVLKNKCGHQLIFYIIFQSVARRLGLRCDIVMRFESERDNRIEIGYIQLFWIPRYESITILNKKYIINWHCRKNIKSFYKKFEKESILPRFIKDWIFDDWIIPDDNVLFERRTLTEMLKLILDLELSYERYDLFDANYITVHRVLQYYVPKTRPQGVKFSVGMIVTHGDQSTDCSTGVIIGWHQAISEKFKIIDEILRLVMPLNICSNFNFTGTRQETHYIILTKNYKLCYVKEDDITLTKPIWIDNIKIYYYFSKFKKTHYVPSDTLAKVYPYDAAITERTIFKD